VIYSVSGFCDIQSMSFIDSDVTMQIFPWSTMYTDFFDPACKKALSVVRSLGRTSMTCYTQTLNILMPLLAI